MAFSPFRAFYGWFGRDQAFGFPHSAQQPDITDTRLNATGSLVTQAPLTVSTQGPRPRLPDMCSRRCKLTLAANAVGGYHSAFRLLVTHKNVPSEVLDSASSDRPLSDGSDIRFSLDEGGAYELPCDIVTYQQDATPANARVEIWVLVPHVSNEAATHVYMWWKGPPEFDKWAESFLFKPSEVWEFYRDFLVGTHGPEDSLSAPRSISRQVPPTSAFTALTASGMAAGPGVWEGNGAFVFASGSARYIYAPSFKFADNDTTTRSGFVSMWFKKDTASFAADGWLFSFGDGLAADPAKKLFARLRASDQKIELRAYTTAGATAYQTIVSTAITDTDWHHLVCSWSGSDIDGVLEMYLDGVLQPPITLRPYGVAAPASMYLVFGSPDLSSTTLHWRGSLDEIRYGTFALPQGYAATEHVCGKYYDQVLTFEAAVAPAAAARPYTLGDRQFLMIGPKLNEPRSVRYEHKFTPVTPYAVGTSDSIPRNALYGSLETGWMFAKRTPSATGKVFRTYRGRRFDSAYFFDTYQAIHAIHNGRDPSHSMQRLQRRGQAAFGYGLHLGYGGEAEIGFFPVSQVATEPQFFSFAGPQPAPPAIEDLYIDTMEIAFPAPSSAASPNPLPTADGFSAVYELLDECYLNGNGASKDIYLSFEATDFIDPYYVKFMVPYGQMYTVREYGADSTFTTVLNTTLVSSNFVITESGLTPGDFRYYKVTPTNPNRETIVQALAATYYI